MSEVATGVDGRPLSQRGERTRRRLLESAEAVFAELGYHAASIVKITEAAGVGQGTFYLYFASKKDVFDELVVDLNHRVRQAMTEAASLGKTRAEMERLGFAGVLPVRGRAPGALSDHPPGGVRLAGDAPAPLRAAHERLRRGLRQAMEAGEIAEGDPELLAWALMGSGSWWACAGSCGQGVTSCRSDVLERARAGSHPHARLPERRHVTARRA